MLLAFVLICLAIAFLVFGVLFTRALSAAAKGSPRALDAFAWGSLCYVFSLCCCAGGAVVLNGCTAAQRSTLARDFAQVAGSICTSYDGWTTCVQKAALVNGEPTPPLPSASAFASASAAPSVSPSGVVGR